MNIKSIVRGIGKYTAALNKLSAETGVSRWYLYPDCAWSWLRYGCVLNHYAEGGFYRRKGFERRAITTYRRWKKIIAYNNPDYCHFLQNKLDFCGLFKDYIGREYLSSRKIHSRALSHSTKASEKARDSHRLNSQSSQVYLSQTSQELSQTRAILLLRCS